MNKLLLRIARTCSTYFCLSIVVFIFILPIFLAYSSGQVIEHECTGGEELLARNLRIKNYKAAAVSVTKFSPLHDKVSEEIGKEIKRELKNYSRDLTNTYKYRGELEKLADFRNDHLIREIIQQKESNLHFLVSSSFPRNKKVNKMITFRTKNQIRKIQ